jgi:hypothetical protein
MIPNEADHSIKPNGKPAPQRGEPDLSQCHAKPAGFGDYVDCMVLKPEVCLHALSFGDGHLCRHPERHQIAARSKASRVNTFGNP